METNKKIPGVPSYIVDTNTTSVCRENEHRLAEVVLYGDLKKSLNTIVRQRSSHESGTGTDEHTISKLFFVTRTFGGVYLKGVCQEHPNYVERTLLDYKCNTGQGVSGGMIFGDSILDICEKLSDVEVKRAGATCLSPSGFFDLLEAIEKQNPDVDMDARHGTEDKDMEI